VTGSRAQRHCPQDLHCDARNSPISRSACNTAGLGLGRASLITTTFLTASFARARPMNFRLHHSASWRSRATSTNRTKANSSANSDNIGVPPDVLSAVIPLAESNCAKWHVFAKQTRCRSSLVNCYFRVCGKFALRLLAYSVNRRVCNVGVSVTSAHRGF